MKTRAIPDHGSLRPIQRTCEPSKVRVAESPGSVESFALPPLWLATVDVFVNQFPANVMRESVSSMRVTSGVGTGVGVGCGVTVGAQVGAPGGGVAVAIGPCARTLKPSNQTS